MELRDVETFLVLAEELHFRRAAARLCVTTGRVSQTLRALETEVGAPLLARNSRRVRLTPLGEQFRVHAEGGLAQLRSALRQAQAEARGIDERLRVGYFTTVGGPYVAELASGFESRYPHCEVLITALPGLTAFDVLDEGEIDLLLAWCPGGTTDALTGEGRRAGAVLATDARAVLVPTGHPLAGLSEVSIEHVAEFELLKLKASAPRTFQQGWIPRHTPSGGSIRRTVDDLGVMVGREPPTIMDLQTTVARDHLAYLTIRSVLNYHPYPGLVTVPIPDLPPCVLTPVWHADRETATIRAFTDLAEQTAHELRPLLGSTQLSPT